MGKFIIIGPLAKDKVIKNGSSYRSIGGPVYYQAAVFSRLKIDNTAVTTLAVKDNDLLNDLPNDTNIIPISTGETIEFENIYPDNNPNHRIQRASIPRNPITQDNLQHINFKDYNAILLSPLYNTDIPLETLEYINTFKIPIYLGAQGYMRHLTKDKKVVLKPWKDHEKYLQFVKILFLDELEARVILGSFHGNLEEIAWKLCCYGPEEVVITRGDYGALICSRKEEFTEYHAIPAFPPAEINDPTGLGDTFMAAYSAKKLESNDPELCGIFASLTSSLKIENKGAFQGKKIFIEEKVRNYFNQL